MWQNVKCQLLHTSLPQSTHSPTHTHFNSLQFTSIHFNSLPPTPPTVVSAVVLCNRCGSDFSDSCRRANLFDGEGESFAGYGYVHPACAARGVDPRDGKRGARSSSNKGGGIYNAVQARSLTLAVLFVVISHLNKVFWGVEEVVMNRLVGWWKMDGGQARLEEEEERARERREREEEMDRKIKKEGDKIQNFWKNLLKSKSKSKKTKTSSKTPSTSPPPLPPKPACGYMKISAVEALALPPSTLDGTASPSCRLTLTGYDVDLRTGALYEFEPR